MVSQRRSNTWRSARSELMKRAGAARAFKERYPYAHVADAVLELRVARDLTQKDLADAAGTTQSVIARLESGRHAVSVELLTRIADAVGADWYPVFTPHEDAARARAPENVVPLFGSRPSPPPVEWRQDGVEVRSAPSHEVAETLSEIQERIEQVKDMVDAASLRLRAQSRRADIG